MSKNFQVSVMHMELCNPDIPKEGLVAAVGKDLQAEGLNC